MQENNFNSEPKIVQTDTGSSNGQSKCPKCGATDITLNQNTGLLRCEFCRYEFQPEKISGMVDDLTKLEGQVLGSGTQDIAFDSKDVITLKCSSCGAEVVIDTASTATARCHWCRNILSINEQIPNGSVPDVILPFSVKKDEAKEKINEFVGKRKFFAYPKFKEEFTTDNIMGVYFPYMIVDINAHVTLVGEGEHQTRHYFRGNGEDTEQFFDADLYHVERNFDLIINGLSIESNSDRLNVTSKEKTNNIINAIMPFDVENSVKYNANYLRGFTSEKRDTNVDSLRDIVEIQSKDIARFAANESLQNYDRGVCWLNEKLDIKGQQWKTAYLPVWLYSYQQVKGDKKILHYVAVNARTKETMGSVPIHMPKLVGVSLLVELLGYLVTIFIDWDYEWIFWLSGLIYFFIIYFKYRNSSARHSYETETKKSINNLVKVDTFLKSEKGLTNPMMYGANNKRVDGKNNGSTILSTLEKENIGSNVIDSVINSNNIAHFIKNNINKKEDK